MWILLPQCLEILVGKYVAALEVQNGRGMKWTAAESTQAKKISSEKIGFTLIQKTEAS